MALSQLLDITADFNAGGAATLDISGWDYAVVQLVTPVGTTSFLTSNDAGAEQGVTDGDASTATNFVAVSGTVLATAAAATTLAAAGLIRFEHIGKFLQLTGTSAAKVLVYLTKIS